jgi:uncharacterized protein (TIGR02145 family)
MGKLILFQNESPYPDDITRNGKLTPSEIDSNFTALKGEDIRNIEYDNGELFVRLNNGSVFSAVLPANQVVSSSSPGEKILDFKGLSNDIVLVTEDKTWAVNINSFPVIKQIGRLTEIVSGHYDDAKGVLTLVKSNGDNIRVSGFLNYMTEGILQNVSLEGRKMVFRMKNGRLNTVDLSALISQVNLDTLDFSGKTVRLNSLKSRRGEPLKINNHLEITKDMTIEKSKMAVGDNNVSGANSLAVGVDNTVSGDNSLAVGTNNANKSDNAAVIGVQNTIDGGTTNAEASLALGRENWVNSRQAFASGRKNRIDSGAIYSLASGSETEVNAPAAQAFGIKSKVTGTGEAAMAQGIATVASGKASHAEGYLSKSQGENSHAEGSSTIANYKDAHAEGYATRAQGQAAHAEGFETKALEIGSHAEGELTSASGIASHAQGARNIVGDSGKYSFAGGSDNLNNAEVSFVFGENNVADASSLKNVYILGRNITAVTRDTLYVNKLNINDLERVRNLRKYFVQQDANGTLYRIDTNDVLEMLNGNFAILTSGRYENYGEGTYQNKIVLTGDVEGYEVVIDGVRDTYVTEGEYDPYTRHLLLRRNDAETIDIDFSGGEIPMLTVKVSTNKTLQGDGTVVNPLRIAPNEQTGQYKPVISIVEELPSVNVVPGDRYITKKEVVRAGYAYAFSDISSYDFGDGWRVPTKNDWNLMLNDLEPDPSFRNHDTPGVSGWRGKVAAVALKDQSFGGKNIFSFGIIPAKYQNSDSTSSLSTETRFWSVSQVMGQWDVYTKRFSIHEGRVFTEPVSPYDELLSVRLVKDYADGDNTAEATINGVRYDTVLMPGQKLWTAQNLADTTIPYTELDENPFGEETVIAEWAVDHWDYQELREGYSVVVMNGTLDYNGHTDDVHDIEYRVINGELVPSDVGGIEGQVQALTEQLNEEVTARQTEGEEISASLAEEITARETQAEEITENLITAFSIETDGDGNLTGNLILEKNDEQRNMVIPIGNFFDFGNSL